MDPAVEAIILNGKQEIEKFKAKDASSHINEFFAQKNLKNPVVLPTTDGSTLIAVKGASKVVDGEAVVQYKDGTMYVGQLLKGQRHGFGVRSYTGAARCYVGNYVADKKVGEGKLYDFKMKAFVFNGQWANDMKNGPGEVNKEEGTFSGSYANDRMEGPGRMTWSNGDSYEGEFKNDLKHGNGKLYFSSGDVYQGQFANGRMHGHGVYTWANGEHFDGEFHDGVMGQGRINFGNEFVGQSVVDGSKRGIEYGLNSAPLNIR